MLVAKLNAARVRRETLNGREYLVVPTTILRPDSVLNGSKGPLFYPAAEVAKNPGAWNGMPLLLNHPRTGSTGRSPRVMAEQGLGYLYNDRVLRNGARVVDAYFDVELTKAQDRDLPTDKRILPRLEAGSPIDVSTGLFTDEQRVRNRLKDARSPAKTADVTTSNYRPDHLAVLPLVRGACSAEDGCGAGVTNMNGDGVSNAVVPDPKFAVGDPVESTAEHMPRMKGMTGRVAEARAGDPPYYAVKFPGMKGVHKWLTEDELVPADGGGGAAGKKTKPGMRGMKMNGGDQTTNEGGPMKLSQKARRGAVQFLTTNCDCWRDKSAALNELEDDALRAVYAQAKDLLANREAVEATREVLGLAGDEGVVFNAEYVKSDAMKKRMKAACAETDDDDEETPMKMKMKKNSAKAGNTGADDGETDDTDAKIKAAVEAAVKDHPAVKNARRIEGKERAKLVGKLTAVANAKGTPPAKKAMILNKLKLPGAAALGVEDLEELLVLVDAPAQVRNEDDDDGGDSLDVRNPYPRDTRRHADYTGAGGGGYQGVENADDDPTENEALAQYEDDDSWEPALAWDGGGVKNRLKGANGKGRAKYDLGDE